MRWTAALLLLLAPCAVAAQGEAPPFLFGFRFGGAQRQSAYLELLHVTSESRSRWSGVARGRGGGRRAGGLADGRRAGGRAGRVHHTPPVAMRTWKERSDLEPGQTYAGVEVQASLFLGVSVAQYLRAGGSAPGPRRYRAIRFVLGF